MKERSRKKCGSCFVAPTTERHRDHSIVLRVDEIHLFKSIRRNPMSENKAVRIASLDAGCRASYNALSPTVLQTTAEHAARLSITTAVATERLSLLVDESLAKRINVKNDDTDNATIYEYLTKSKRVVPVGQAKSLVDGGHASLVPSDPIAAYLSI
jgi:hypothetical protein